MRNDFCVTAREAAEMADMTAAELSALIERYPGLAMRVGESWRVSPTMLRAVLDDRSMPLKWAA